MSRPSASRLALAAIALAAPALAQTPNAANTTNAANTANAAVAANAAPRPITAATRPLNPQVRPAGVLAPRPATTMSASTQAAIQQAVAAALAAERASTANANAASANTASTANAAPRPAAPPRTATPLNLRTDGAPSLAANTSRSSGGSWGLGILLLGGLAGAGLWLLKRRPDLLARAARGGATPVWGGSLQVLRRTSLGLRNELVVVDAGGQVLLLGVTAGSIQTLAMLPDAEGAAESEAPAREEVGAVGERFAAILEAARNQNRKAEKTDRAERNDRVERSERAERVERAERPERRAASADLSGVEEQARGLLALRGSES